MTLRPALLEWLRVGISAVVASGFFYASFLAAVSSASYGSGPLMLWMGVASALLGFTGIVLIIPVIQITVTRLLVEL